MSDDDVKLCSGFARVVDSLDAMLQHREALIQELAAMTAAKELAERQVAILCRNTAFMTSEEDAACLYCKSRYGSCDMDIEACVNRLSDWSRAEAAKGVQGGVARHCSDCERMKRWVDVTLRCVDDPTHDHQPEHEACSGFVARTEAVKGGRGTNA